MMTNSQPPTGSPPPARKRSLNPLVTVLLLSGLFFALFLGVSAKLFWSKSDNGSSGMGASIFGDGAIGVIEMNGVIMDSKKTLARLERFAESEEIKGVVLRLNSPGGSVAPSQEIYEAVKKFKKPLVVSMASVAASGAYYIACGAKKVFANAGTITGSIGVIMEFANLEKLYDWAKIKRYAIKTGRYKDAGAEYREMNEDERALLQGMVDDVLLQFKQAVVEGRKLNMAQVTAVADGRIFSGSQAKAAKLVDEIGTLDDAIHEVAKMAGLKGEPQVIYPEKKKHRLLDMLMDEGSADESSAYGDAADSRSMLRSGLLGAVIQGLVGDAAEVHSAQQKILGLAPGVYWLWQGAR